ncbi:MAG TPA: hypothetical protein VFJ57_08090 [Solirubrobacterales bacterium]|nr:hypothetical protein [Solirubrobacterales bacterium]
MKALVLSGGGVAGISWMLGIVEGLARGEAIERQRRDENAEIVVPFAIDEFLAAIDRARAEEPTEAAALVRIANMEPLGPTSAKPNGGR